MDGPPRRINLKIWLYTSPDRVRGAEITLVSSSGNHKAKPTCDPYAAVALTADTKSTGRCLQVMAQPAIDKIPPGPKLDALTAERSSAGKTSTIITTEVVYTASGKISLDTGD